MVHVRTVIVGAGGVGGTIGGLLAAADREVLLVTRGEHGARIAAAGLTVRRPGGDVRVRCPVVSSIVEAELRRDDIVVLAVQSQQTAAVIADLAAMTVDGDRATEALPVFSAQNGVTNEDELLRLAPAVHAVCVNLPATRLEPGVVIAEAAPVAGVLTLGLATGGSDEVDHAVAADLTAAGFTAPVVDDAMAWKRAKLLRNLGNALDALTGSRHDTAAVSVVDDLHARATAEGRAVFAAAGLAVVADDRWAANTSGYRVLPVAGRTRGGGSTWQTLTRGGATVETDLLNGEVIRLARLHGVPVPVNRMLQREMWRLVDTGGAPGSRSPSALAAAV